MDRLDLVAPLVGGLALGLVLGGGTVHLLGSGKQAGPPAPAVAPPSPPVAPSPGDAPPPPPSPEPSDLPPRDDPASEAPEAPEAPGPTAQPPPAGPDVVAAAVAARRAARHAPLDLAAERAALEAQGALDGALRSDPAALDAALAALRTLDDPFDLEVLTDALARRRLPAVAAAALAIARDDAHVPRRLAALAVLGTHEAPEARALVAGQLAREPDVEVRRALLRALPSPAGASLDDAAPVVAALTRALGDDADAEVRRAAAVALGRWHRVPRELEPLTTALASDPSPDVRTGAAFGLELARRRDPPIVAALVTALASTDPTVGEAAWRALGALGPLPPEAAAAWADHARARPELTHDDHPEEDTHDHH